MFSFRNSKALNINVDHGQGTDDEVCRSQLQYNYCPPTAAGMEWNRRF